MAIINVTTTLDENNGTGDISLREAIIQATNNSVEDDTIVLEPNQTYTLTIQGFGEDASATGDLDVLSLTGSLTILTSTVSGSTGVATIDAAGIDRVFDVKENANLTLENLIVKGGQPILSSTDTITLLPSGLDSGGGISNLGTLNLNNVTVTSNTASSGGGIDNLGSMKILESNINSNTTNYASDGGGINNKGLIDIANSNIIFNSAYGGGGVSNQSGTINISNSTISSNNALWEGGGIYNKSGTMNISNVTIDSNISRFGGGIDNTLGIMNISNSTISSNTSRQGAGIINTRSVLNLENTTITGNAVVENIQNQAGLFSTVSSVSISNSIIAQNNENKDIEIDSLSSFISQGYNIIGNATGVEQIFDNTSDRIGTANAPIDAKLGPLENNGGPTFTHALLEGSPAIDAGNTTLPTDQRGFSRIGTPDIGAYESSNLNPTFFVSGTSFIDLNNNGIWDPFTDQALSDVTVFLDINNNDSLDAQDRQTRTDTQGFYLLDDLQYDIYTVKQIDPPGYTRVTPVEPINVSDISRFDIANIPEAPGTGNISGIKFIDTNSNGVFDAGIDQPQSGVTIFLDQNNNGLLDNADDSLGGIGAVGPVGPANAPIAELRTETDSLGSYSFQNLPIGTYQVEEIVPPGFNRLTPITSVAVNANETTNFDIANVPEAPGTGNISGRKFIDNNSNGVFDTGIDQPQSGVTIFLDQNNNGLLDNADDSLGGIGVVGPVGPANAPIAELRTETDSLGSYSFQNLPIGTYQVEEIVPPGFNRLTPITSVAVNANETTNFDIANVPETPATGNISGIKFIDNNSNGVFDPETDQPQSGVTIFLDQNNNGLLDNGEFNTQTDDGSYVFTDLTPGSYTVQEIVPAGFNRITPVQSVNVNANQTTNFDIANIPEAPGTGNISGRKFIDQNNNGSFEPEFDQPQSGVTIFLDQNNNGQLDAGEFNTQTDLLGNYLFTNLAPDSYTVQEVVPAGFNRITPITSVAVNANETTTFNIANIPEAPATGNIRGRKFIDNNSNNIIDPEIDQPQSGVTIFLDQNNNGLLDNGEFNTQTDLLGNYLFNNLAPDSYTVQEVVPAGFNRITPITSVAVNANETTTFNVANIPEAPATGTISGIKFNDLNANTIFDTGEPGIAGIPIYLDINNNAIPEPNEPGTLTDTRGFYQFDNVQPNTYIVREVQQPGFISTQIPNPVTILPGLNVENINFGSGIPGILEFSSPFFSVNEDGTTNMDVMVTRTGGSVGTVDVTVLPSNGTATAGTDYDPTPITISFINGDNTPKPVRIPIINDSRIEPAETINLALLNPSNGAVLGAQSTATLTINSSDAGVPLNLGNIGDLQTVANNPLALESGVNFSTNALGIVSVQQGGSGNFIDPLTNPGQLSQAITYDQGQAIIIDVIDGFDDKFSFRYASPFVNHQITIYDGVNGTGNILATAQLPRTPDSNLTPGAYILENNVASTLLFEGIAKSVVLGSQPNKLLINNLTFG